MDFLVKLRVHYGMAIFGKQEREGHPGDIKITNKSLCFLYTDFSRRTQGSRNYLLKYLKGYKPGDCFFALIIVKNFEITGLQLYALIMDQFVLMYCI